MWSGVSRWFGFSSSSGVCQARTLFDYLQWLGFVDTATALAADYVARPPASASTASSSASSSSSSKAKAIGASKGSVLTDPKQIAKQRPATLFNVIERVEKRGGKTVTVEAPLHPLDPRRLSFVRFQLQVCSCAVVCHCVPRGGGEGVTGRRVGCGHFDRVVVDERRVLRV